MTFEILIVEDQELYADQLEMMVEKLGYGHAGTVNNSRDALRAIQTRIPDLILMDIHIKGEHDGIELASLIHDIHPVPIIFITSLKDDLTFNRASRTRPLQFLLKPFDRIQLQRTVELAVRGLNTKQESGDQERNTDGNDFIKDGYFFIKVRQRLEKVSVDDILYLEADGHHCRIHTSGGKYLVRISMSELGKQLSPQDFMQTHRGFLVKKDRVDSVDLKDSVVVVSGNHIPLSKRNREGVLKRLNWL